jgi:hypothetical protein
MAHDGHAAEHHHPYTAPGHNSRAARQWQTPHLPEGHTHDHAHDHAEPDLDLVETAFLQSFPTAPDPTSFLRLAGVPFSGKAADGRTLRLLRVESSQTTDVGTLTPHLGGTDHRYDPLPAKLTSRRQTLAFAYFDGDTVVRLSLTEAKALTPD